MMHNLCIYLSIGQVSGFVVDDDSDVSYLKRTLPVLYMISNARTSAALIASYIVPCHGCLNRFLRKLSLSRVFE